MKKSSYFFANLDYFSYLTCVRTIIFGNYLYNSKNFCTFVGEIIRAGTPTEEQKAQMAAYGFSAQMTEAECVAELFKMYQQLTSSER